MGDLMSTPSDGPRQAVILAAGEQQGFDTPVGLLEIADTTVIERLIEQLTKVGVEKIVIIAGFQADAFDRFQSERIQVIRSDRYKWTGTMHSLALAKNHIDADFFLIEGDIVLEERGFDHVLASPSANCLLIVNESGLGDSCFVELRHDHIFRISKDIHQLSRLDGEFIGLSKITLAAFRDMVAYYSESLNPYLHYEYAMLAVSDTHPLGYVKVDDLVWTEVDTPDHYRTLKYIVYPKLLRREKEHHEARIRQQFQEALGPEYEIVAPIEQLGGMNNANYKITTNRGQFVLRLPGKGTNETVDRRMEQRNSQLAYAIGLDCETVYTNIETGVKITRYISGAETFTIASAKREPNMELMAVALRRLHTCQRLFDRDFDPYANIRMFERDVDRCPELYFDEYQEVRAELLRMKDELEALGLEHVACHLDAWPENFIKGDDGIYLIDYEYAGNYDPLWDVVSVGLECEYTPDQEELFLLKYFGRQPDEVERQKMDILRVLMDVHWSMWSLAKVACGDKGLYEYSLMRFRRGLGNLSKLRLKSPV